MPLRKPPKSDAQLDIFSAIFSDISTRDVQDTMEAPFLSLSKKPRLEPIKYESNGIEVMVTGSNPHGIATIWDWDLMMWLMSQIRHAMDNKLPVSRQIRFSRGAFLRDARRNVSGDEYRRLATAIDRLRTTNVQTTIRAPKGRRRIGFSWLEYTETESDVDDAIREALVVIPEWLFDAITDKSRVLTLHRDYYLLSGGLERWLYRFIRKAAGRDTWRWKMKTLHERSGSTRSYKYFARDLRKIIKKEVLLDYKLSEEKGDSESYVRARKIPSEQNALTTITVDNSINFLALKTTTYEKARQLAPRYDIYALEKQWREATIKNKVEIRDPDSAFLGWCKVVAGRKETIDLLPSVE